MRFFLTGAATFQAAQKIVYKSLGGYPSSTPVRNNVISNVFDSVSALQVQDGRTEYKALALRNETGQDVTNIRLWVVAPENPRIGVRVAFATFQDDGCGGVTMERIDNMNVQPYYADFFNATSTYSQGVLQILTPATTGEVATILGVQTTFGQPSYTVEQTRDAIVHSFENNLNYGAKAVDETTDSILFSALDPEVNSVLVDVTTLGTVTANPITTSGNENNVTAPAGNPILTNGSYFGLWLEKNVSRSAATTDVQEEDCVSYGANDPYDTQDYKIIVDYNFV